MDVSFFIAGLFGGLLRGGMGLFKYTFSYKDIEIRPYYFAGMVLLTGLVGWISAWVARDALQIFLDINGSLPVSLAVVAGYAGGDFIENVFKILMKEPQLFDIGRKVKQISEEIEEEIGE